jgi:hypothetical protein
MSAGVSETMREAVVSLEYAADALEASDGCHMRAVTRDLKAARKTVAELVDYADRLFGFAYHHADITALRAGGGMLDAARDVIDRAKGDEA